MYHQENEKKRIILNFVKFFHHSYRTICIHSFTYSFFTMKKTLFTAFFLLFFMGIAWLTINKNHVHANFLQQPIGQEVIIEHDWDTKVDTTLQEDFVPSGTMVIEPVEQKKLIKPWSIQWDDPFSIPDRIIEPVEPIDQETIGDIPLKHTSMESHISWFVSRTYVTQVFENNTTVPIEATYMFPLPHEASVDAMEMKIGERLIVWNIERREEAQRQYNQAKQQWKMPWDQIEVTISYFQTIAYDSGKYTYVFPMVVWPRYIWAWVKDWNAITSPSLPKTRNAHDIDVTLHLDWSVPLQNIASASHDIVTTKSSDSKVLIRLSNEKNYPNKDLSITYSLAWEKNQTGVLFHQWENDDHGYVTVMVEPTAAPKKEEILPKEVVFVLDTSGSMWWRPIKSVKKAMTKAINNLNEWDTFNIIDFAGNLRVLFDESQQATMLTKNKWIQYVNQLRAWWWTVMDRPLQKALELSKWNEWMLRTVLVMTDGDVWNENTILNLITNKLEENRIFVFGVDAAANRYLLDRMAEQWKWKATYILNDEEINEKVDEFYESFKAPLLTNISLNRWWVEVNEMLPQYIPDLYAWQPIQLTAQYKTNNLDKNTILTISGWQWNKQYKQEIPLTFPWVENNNDSLKSLRWRVKVKEIIKENRFDRNQNLKEDITQLWLTYNIMTEHTSFIAVDDQVRNTTGQINTIEVPIYQVEGKTMGRSTWSYWWFKMNNAYMHESMADSSWYAKSSWIAYDQVSVIWAWSSNGQLDSSWTLIKGIIQWVIWWILCIAILTWLYFFIKRRNDDDDLSQV